MPSSWRLLSPPGRTGSQARGTCNNRKRSLRRNCCEHGGAGFGPVGCSEAPAIEHKACAPTIGGEPPRAISAFSCSRRLQRPTFQRNGTNYQRWPLWPMCACEGHPSSKFAIWHFKSQISGSYDQTFAREDHIFTLAFFNIIF